MDEKYISQCSTSRKQSERLIGLGVRIDTADMYYHPLESIPSVGEVLEETSFLPSWSLHQLMCLCPSTYRSLVGNHTMYFQVMLWGVFYCDDYDRETVAFDSNENLYDNMIDCIEWLIKENLFNKEYLKKDNMGRYDYQENPQVLYWKEQCETLREKLERANTVLAESLEKKGELLVESLVDEVHENENLRQQLKELKEDICSFNQLPWYEKLMYKFEI